MNNYVLDAIVAGAGHAGLGASYYLKKHGLTHIVFERGKIGESWLSKRWDGFVLNSSNKFNVLPGDEYAGDDPGGFPTAAAFAASLETYARKFRLPVSEYTTITAVEKTSPSGLFKVTVQKHGNNYTYYSRQMIIASGGMTEKNIPLFGRHIDGSVKQLHAGEYRSATHLPEGAVLVVGSAQSGCQIAEELAETGKKVFLSTSMVGRIPRRYRGRDMMEWLFDMRFFDTPAGSLPDGQVMDMKAPQLTGRDGGKRTISLQSLAKKGITILGKMETASGKDLFFQRNAAKHIRFADEFSANVKKMVDQFILQQNMLIPAAQFDEADMPDTAASADAGITWLETGKHAISSVIWATGYAADFSYIRLPVFDVNGRPVHCNGTSNIHGLYFLGLPWLRTRKSSVIAGIKEDAGFICAQVAENIFEAVKAAV